MVSTIMPSTFETRARSSGVRMGGGMYGSSWRISESTVTRHHVPVESQLGPGPIELSANRCSRVKQSYQVSWNGLEGTIANWPTAIKPKFQCKDNNFQACLPIYQSIYTHTSPPANTPPTTQNKNKLAHTVTTPASLHAQAPVPPSPNPPRDDVQARPAQ